MAIDIDLIFLKRGQFKQSYVLVLRDKYKFFQQKKACKFIILQALKIT